MHDTFWATGLNKYRHPYAKSSSYWQDTSSAPLGIMSKYSHSMIPFSCQPSDDWSSRLSFQAQNPEKNDWIRSDEDSWSNCVTQRLLILSSFHSHLFNAAFAVSEMIWYLAHKNFLLPYCRGYCLLDLDGELRRNVLDFKTLIRAQNRYSGVVSSNRVRSSFSQYKLIPFVGKRSEWTEKCRKLETSTE